MSNFKQREAEVIYKKLSMSGDSRPSIKQLVNMRSFVRRIENNLNNKINTFVVNWRNKNANRAI